MSAVERERIAPVLPRTLRPMLAAPADGPLDDPAYAYELKWDGMRVLAGVRGGEWSLLTRNGLEAAPRFPEMAALAASAAGREMVLDGEIVVMCGGRPSFGDLQLRIQAAAPLRIRELAESVPAALVVFDILRFDDHWLFRVPWTERRELLEREVTPSAVVALSPVWESGRQLWDVVCQQELEGVMAKLRCSGYRPGIRSPTWRKIKRVDTMDLVVGGWTEGEGALRGEIGALLVGRRCGEKLEFLGHVGTGFDHTARVESRLRLAPLASADCPFQPVPRTNAPSHWVRPQLVCEVRFQGWGAEGRLRAPVFVRWRPDKTAVEF